MPDCSGEGKMPLHGRVPARIFPVMNGWWPYGPWGATPRHPRRGISNPLDPDYRLPGAALGGTQNAPLAFVVHGVTARNFLPCAGPLHPRLARSLREYCRQPRRSGWPSSPPPPPAQAAGLPFPRPSSSTVRGPVRGTGPIFARTTGLRERAAGKPVPARPRPGHGIRRAVRTRLHRASGPWRIHPGGRRIRSLGRKKGAPSQIGAPGPGEGPKER